MLFIANIVKISSEYDVQLYEFLSRPDAENLNTNTKELAENLKVSLKGLSRSSLHAKLMAIDEKQVFIGSFNFDPRSAYLNTEIGVLPNSPRLAKAVHYTMDENLSKYAYKLVLNADQQINWKIKLSNGQMRRSVTLLYGSCSLTLAIRT